MTEFTASEKERLLTKTDKMYDKITDLCGRMIRVETNLKNHLESQKRKFDKRMVILGIIVAAIAVVIPTIIVVGLK